MEIKRVALVIFDISGYTEFIRQNKETLGHAHKVVSQLLEHVVEGAVVNAGVKMHQSAGAKVHHG